MNNGNLGLSQDELTRSLSYAGFILLAFELMKSLIVGPIKSFYRSTTFQGGPFTSYELDVLSRHKNEFEACLLYLRDFMEALSSDDVLAIQGLRKHRNELAHNLPGQLKQLDLGSCIPLLVKADQALFKLSNHQTYLEVGQDPAYQDKGIDWEGVYGGEYAVFKEVIENLKLLERTES